VLILCAFFAQGCSLIDDDLTACGVDFEMILSMELVTDLDLELETTLSAETDIYTKTVLRNYFSNIFTDHAHDINIGFFNTTTDELVYSIFDTIDDTQSSYTFYLPKNEYYAIALANLAYNEIAQLADSDNSRMAKLKTPAIDTLSTQRTGLFAVSREISVIDTADQRINLTLHMITCALALVIDTTGVPTRGIWSHMTNTAEGMMLRDSLFNRDLLKVVRLEEITPSKEKISSPNVGEVVQSARGVSEQRKAQLGTAQSASQNTSDPQTDIPYLLGCASFPTPDEAESDGSYYQVKVYVTLSDESITETTLSVQEPLQASQLKIIKLELQDDGSVLPTKNSEVGASVKLDWNDGGEHNIEL